MPGNAKIGAGRAREFVATARARVLVGFLAGAVLVAGTVAAAAAEKFGAIAFSTDSGRAGWSFDYDSRARAESEALASCGGGCKIVIWFKNACGALATGGNNAYGAAWANSRAEAEQKATGFCRQRSASCSIRRWVCTTR
ncbi:hypothetical protein CCR97_08390 [Rhodoplanes elegans]|uniref:DUF4189 domain-containing protein n=1 Tax=Rhodoplanes elegans TaxID=29408 RepID=UPI001911AE4B|nr:DUF4189 domain-containing protein [Rhodoplanes elegans]MBK5958228.1 hypothetical protein [Rhodoplanes elegans]